MVVIGQSVTGVEAVVYESIGVGVELVVEEMVVDELVVVVGQN